MQAGLLWFDNDPQRDVATKVLAAAQRYQERFGAAPDTCYVNHTATGGVVQALSWQGRPLHIVPSSRILAHHFWVGVETPQPA